MRLLITNFRILFTFPSLVFLFSFSSLSFMQAILPQQHGISGFSCFLPSTPILQTSPPPSYDSDTPSPADAKLQSPSLLNTTSLPSPTLQTIGGDQLCPTSQNQPFGAASRPFHPFACELEGVSCKDTAGNTSAQHHPADLAGHCYERNSHCLKDKGGLGRAVLDGGSQRIFPERIGAEARESLIRARSLRGMSLTLSGLSIPRRAAEILRRFSGRSAGGTSMEAGAAVAAAAAEAAEARQVAAALGPLPGWRIEPFAASTLQDSSRFSSTVVPRALFSAVGGDVANGGVEEPGEGAKDYAEGVCDCSVHRSSHEIPDGPQVEEPMAMLRPSPAWLADQYSNEAVGRRFSSLSSASTASIGATGFCDSAAPVAGWLRARKRESVGNEAVVGTSGSTGFILYPAD
jgi:hypothetical protein